MAFPGKDGKSYGSQMQAFQAKPAMPDAGADPAMDKPPITENPEAMAAVDKLKELGYTGEDVEQAMGGAADEMDNGAEATKAAPLQIPGLQ
jgi:Holliday junction resolvasome RuvABC DNA-binding subunit